MAIPVLSQLGGPEVFGSGQVQLSDSTGQSGNVPVWDATGTLTDSGTTPSFLVQALVDFDFRSASGEGDTATVTVPAPWVTANSIIACNAAAAATADHDPEDAVVEGIQAYATNLQPGVSFDIEAYAPNGTWGSYLINAVGR